MLCWAHHEAIRHSAAATPANLIWYNFVKIIIERVKMWKNMKFVRLQERARAHFVLGSERLACEDKKLLKARERANERMLMQERLNILILY